MTKIEWTDETWNPVTGCTKISPGCEHCYARRMAQRLAGRCGYPRDDPFRVILHEETLDKPLHWRKPRRVFVCSMGDLFHENVPDEYRMQVFNRCVAAPRHTFQILTKRPANALRYYQGRPALPNVWLGVSPEDQERADQRIPVLMECPAAVRFVSVEPMLGPVDLTPWLYRTREIELADDGAHIRRNRILPALDWVICGCETGPGARAMDPNWARSLRDQCVAAGVPFFLKRLSDGSRLLDEQEWDEYPQEAR